MGMSWRMHKGVSGRGRGASDDRWSFQLGGLDLSRLEEGWLAARYQLGLAHSTASTTSWRSPGWGWHRPATHHSHIRPSIRAGYPPPQQGRGGTRGNLSSRSSGPGAHSGATTSTYDRPVAPSVMSVPVAFKHLRQRHNPFDSVVKANLLGPGKITLMIAPTTNGARYASQAAVRLPLCIAIGELFPEQSRCAAGRRSPTRVDACHRF